MLALRADRVAVVAKRDWMYCTHTQQSEWSATRGCVGRIRCRTPCGSLACVPSGVKAGMCVCANESCAAIAGNHGVYTTFTPCSNKDPRYRDRVHYGVFDLRVTKHPTFVRACVDVAGRQLFHGCPPAPASERSDLHSFWRNKSCGTACPWPRRKSEDVEKPVAFASLADLPRCILPSLADVARMATVGRCDLSRTHSSSVGEGWARKKSGTMDGVLPVRPDPLTTRRPRCAWENRQARTR